MATNRNVCRRRILVLGMVAAVVGGVLAAVVPRVAAATEPFDSYTDMGGLRLQLGLTTYADAPADFQTIHDPAPPRFVYETKEQPGRTGFYQGPSQFLQLSGKCGAILSDADAKLAMLTSGPFPLGIGPDSLGVYDGPKGVACYRISSGPKEWIQFDIGPALKEMGARSFYRLELDIEVKQNARFELQILRGGEPYGAPWVLESGSSISADASYTPGASHWACMARSDSGPDAGAGDNCRWVINGLGDGFILRATVGEGSLEGGGDFGVAAYANNTVIFLTDAEVGVLGCANSLATRSPYTSTIGDGVNSAQCSVTRVDPTTHGGTCTTNIPYLFRTLPGGVEGCELAKNPGEQMAAVINVVFPPEPRVELNGKTLTEIRFPNPAGGTVDFAMPRCAGTLDLDANDDGVRFDGVSPDPTIDEVLSNPGVLADFFNVDTIDQVLSTDHMEWACILEDEEDYVGDDLMRVRQKILFWGDPILIRQ
jgi:hypothetical protein